jgi:rhomboid protease GluP
MNEPPTDPLEKILRLCAAAAPGPWYPRLYAQKHNVDPVTMDSFLEELWLEGLVERSGGGPDTGPGLALTERGREVLDDPETLERLRAGRPLVEGDQGGTVRQVLRAPVRPVVTWLLVLANLAVFGYGVYLAHQRGMVREFVAGVSLFGKQPPLDVRVKGVLDASGAVSKESILDGQWWRLLTGEWVHVGLMHLLLNLFGLYVVGRQGEPMWGHLRYLVIALASGWAGVCVGVATQPENVIGGGASGTVLGVMAAEVVWWLCNRRHLPRALRRRAMSGMIVNVVLLAVIFVSSSGSGGGHVAGVTAGAAAALLLQVQRFGAPALRAPAGAAVVLVPVVAFAMLDYAVSDDKFENRYVMRTEKLTREAEGLYQKEVKSVVGMHPIRRNPETVEGLLPRLEQMRSDLARLVAELEKVGPRHDEDSEKGRQAALAYAAAQAERCERLARYLRAGEQRTHRDETALKEQDERVEEKKKAWKDLLQPAGK